MATLVGGRFGIEGIAGHGGMGTVFRARDATNDTVVALKMIDRSFASSRFEREASLLARLSHEAIVGYIAHGKLSDGRMFLAMELIDGQPLDALLFRGPLSVADSLVIARRIGGALAAGHALGIIHRDVKPSNVVLRGGRPDAAMLVDFGTARVSDGLTATGVGAVMGTPQYMAPEQARGDASIDGRADVFSLGCVLFECLTGQAPFAARRDVACLAKVLFEPAPSLPDVPPALDQLVAAMLAKDPADRPADVVRAIDGLDDPDAEKPAPSPRPVVRCESILVGYSSAPRWELLASPEAQSLTLHVLANGLVVGAGATSAVAGCADALRAATGGRFVTASGEDAAERAAELLTKQH